MWVSVAPVAPFLPEKATGGSASSEENPVSSPISGTTMGASRRGREAPDILVTGEMLGRNGTGDTMGRSTNVASLLRKQLGE